MSSLIGKILGKYQVIERIGKGGMAEVYKARHPRLDRDVAIKVLHGFLAEDAEFLARFEREANAIAALRHPHIIQVYDFDVEGDDYYMVVEYVDGGSLKDTLSGLAMRKRYMSYGDVSRIFRQMASALDYAHQQGMLHRDIKPANILVDRSGNTYLTDFGIARILSDTHLTATGTLIGTPAYMSPEQGKGLKATVTSEVYSLGVILYELVTGKVPFDADTPFGLIMKHVHETLPLPRSVRSDLPEALEAVICKALAKEPENRYQSVSELLLAAGIALEPLAVDQDAVHVVEMTDAVVDEESAARLSQISELQNEQEVQRQVLESEGIAAAATQAMQPASEKENALAEPEGADAAQIAGSSSRVGEGATPEEIAALDTLAMDAAEPLVADEPLVDGDRVLPAVERPSGEKATSQGIKSIQGAKPQPRKRRRGWIVIAAAVVVMAAAGLGLWYSGLFDAQPEAVCDDFEACLESIEPMWQEENFPEVVARLDRALELRPDDANPPFAFLWCEKGVAFLAMEEPEAALQQFTVCMDWTEDSPEFEDVRIMAIEHIEMIEHGDFGE